MTNQNQRSLGQNRGVALTNGRMTDSRVGAGRSNQSNYLVTNDGVQTMDLPRNFTGPRSAEPSNRKTPILIPPIKYIVYNNPQVAYDFLISKGLNVEPNIPSTLQFAMIFIKQEGDPGILEFIAAAHPDKEVILKAMNASKESSFTETPMGNDAKKVEPMGNPDVKKEATESKSEFNLMSWMKSNSQPIIIILIIIVLFVILRRPRA